jgi:hypothetical protein
MPQSAFELEPKLEVAEYASQYRPKTALSRGWEGEMRFVRWGCLALVGVATGCTSFSENHYFQSVCDPPNYFRLTIDGTAGLSAAKYISGYYDERAVDLLFNELKPVGPQPPQPANLMPAPTTSPNASPSPGAAGAPASTGGGAGGSAISGAAGSAPTVEAGGVTYDCAHGGRHDFAPLDPSKRGGAFVMVLSTNANAVADAIGNFADSNVAADAITNIVNRERVATLQTLEAQLAAASRRAGATKDELTKLFALVKTQDPPAAETQDAYLRILNAISRALGSPQSFLTLAEARKWFATARETTTGSQ